MLEIRHLTKQYGEKTAVDDLTLTIRPGEIFGFIGPNGAGKTTTLKCCCGILQPDRGEVRVNGCSMRDDPLAAKRQLAYLPDDPALYGYMTGIQYLDFIADVFGVREAARAERVRVSALDRDGEPFELDASGLLAVCIQHEMDHLDGKLFVDYLSVLKRDRIRKKLEKQARLEARAS